MSTKIKLRGDACPPWCGGVHDVQRTQADGTPLHPDDCGVMHVSRPVDSWQPELEGSPQNTINVTIKGKRHDHDEDWPDHVLATNVAPGWVSEVELEAADARRLGEALITAANTVEGKS